MNEIPTVETPSPTPGKRSRLVWIAGLIVLTVLATAALWPRSQSTTPAEATKHEEKEEKHEESGAEVVLPEAARTAAGIETIAATAADLATEVRVTGTVEPNQMQTQQVTPLVSGRIEKVQVVLGDRVRAGTVLAEMASPEIAELHGKLHEAETRLTIAERNYQRVQQPESRVSVVQARAKLDEAEATLNRTRKLIELGSAAGKDLTSAEAAYRTAKAEYEFQSQIGLNREVQELKAIWETTQAEVRRIRDGLGALGAPVSQKHENQESNVGLLRLRATLDGTVTERLVNSGAGVEAGKPVFTIANLSTVWVMANVPPSLLARVTVGTRAEIRTAEPGSVLTGTITYLDPMINEETRTAKARIEVPNSDGRLRAGMFVEAVFSNRNGDAAPATGAQATVLIPEEAIQQVGDRKVVFLPKPAEEGAFEVREVEVGDRQAGMVRITGGLKAGEPVVTKGSFTLKTQLMKGELGEHSH